MSFVFIEIDEKHKSKLEDFLKSLPDNEVEYIIGDDEPSLDKSLDNLLEKKNIQVDEDIEKFKAYFADVEDEEWDEEYDIDMDLMDEEGNIIDYTITFEYLEPDDYYDFDLYKEDFKLIRLFFDNGEVAEKEFMSKRYFELILSHNEFFSEDVIVVDEIKIEKIFEIVDEAIRDGVFEFLFDRVEKDFDIDEDFQNLNLN